METEVAKFQLTVSTAALVDPEHYGVCLPIETVPSFASG